MAKLKYGDEVIVDWDYIKTLRDRTLCTIPEDITKYKRGMLFGSPFRHENEPFERSLVWFPEVGDYIPSDWEITSRDIKATRFVPVDALTLIEE
jgi:hypothetical protein